MIESSFIHLERFGRKKEEHLWRQGILTWNDFLNTKRIKGISPSLKNQYDKSIKEASYALREKDAKYFFNHFPFSESWRLYSIFKNYAVFLDIETSACYGDITLVGLYNGEHVATFIKGYNLTRENLIKALRSFKLIVTFNGSCFDIPLLKRRFGEIFPQIPHIDLRFACRKLGLRGGLKKIEKLLGIKRDKEIEGIKSEDAVYLWEMFNSTRKKHYLEALITYNKADIVNLEPLAEFCYRNLKYKIFDSVRKEIEISHGSVILYETSSDKRYC